METAMRTHLHLPLFPRPSFVSKPFSVSSSPSPSHRKPIRLRATIEPSPSRPISKSLQALTISIAAAAAAAAALLLPRPHRHRLPFASISAPTAAVESKARQPQPAVPEFLPNEEKEKALEAYLESNPDDTGSLRALMEVKVRLRKLHDAIAVADRLIPLESEDSDLPLLRAHFMLYNGDVEAAKEAFESILQVNPLFVEAYHGLVMAVSKNEEELDGILDRVEEMIKVCKKEKEKNKSELRDFKLLKAQVMVIEGEYQEALKIYQELAKEEPRDFRPYLCQGIIYTLLRKKDEAVKQFDKYRRLVPKGHPYAKYFEENMAIMGSLVESKKKAAAQN